MARLDITLKNTISSPKEIKTIDDLPKITEHSKYDHIEYGSVSISVVINKEAFNEADPFELGSMVEGFAEELAKKILNAALQSIPLETRKKIDNVKAEV